MDTERIHDRIFASELEMEKIERDCADLHRAVDALLSDFLMKHSKADIIGLSSDFGASLAVMQEELSEPHDDAKRAAENELEDIEWAEIERRSPVVL